MAHNPEDDTPLGTATLLRAKQWYGMAKQGTSGWYFLHPTCILPSGTEVTIVARLGRDRICCWGRRANGDVVYAWLYAEDVEEHDHA